MGIFNSQNGFSTFIGSNVAGRWIFANSKKLNMNKATILGFLAGFLTTAAFFPQVWKTWKSKSATDLSLGMFIVFSLGVFCWLAYGIMISQTPIIIWKAITLILALVILLMKLKLG